MSEVPVYTPGSLRQPQSLASSTRMLQNRVVSDSDVVSQSETSVKRKRRRWSDQDPGDRMESDPEETSGGENDLLPSCHASFDDSEEFDLDTYPYPINVHRVPGNGTQTPEYMSYHGMFFHAIPYHHFGFYDGMPTRTFMFNPVTIDHPGIPTPVEQTVYEPKESDPSVASRTQEAAAAMFGENDMAPIELTDKYRVIDILKQAVSLLPPVYNKPDAPALIPSTKRVMTAIKFHHMLPDKFPYPLHNSTDRREEKIFFDPSHTAMQWFGYGRQHALLMGIRAQDHITLGIRLKGTFQDLYNQTREMFYMQKGNVYYAGTYKCLRIEQIINNPEIVESLDISLISKAFKADMIKAAVHAQPPTNDLTSRLDLRKMTELCYNGTIKFEWVALQCMGFDEDVFQALGGQYVAPSVPIVGHVLKLLHTSTAEQGIPQLSEDDSDASIDNT